MKIDSDFNKEKKGGFMFCHVMSICREQLESKNGKWLICILAVMIIIEPVARSVNGVICAPAPFSQQLTEEEYVVYSALLNRLSLDYDNQLLVIVDHTWDHGFSSEEWRKKSRGLRRIIKEVDRSALESYNSHNMKRHQLTLSFKLKTKAILVHDQLEQIREDYISGKDGWEEFHKKFPQSKYLLTLSRVGFNQAMDQALVSVITQAGITEGGTTLYLLRKISGVWKVRVSAIVDMS